MPQSSQSPVGTEQWKRKYYDSLESIEQKERRWRQVEDILRKTISRLTLAADGLDATLDQQLRELRNAIRDRVDENVLMHRIEVMSQALVRLDSIRLEKSRAPGPADALNQLLDMLKLPARSAQQLKALKKQLQKSETANLEPLLRAFADVLHGALQEGGDPKPKESQGTVLNRLFGKKSDQEGASAPDTADTGSKVTQQGLSGREVLLDLVRYIAAQEDGEKRISELRNRIQYVRSDDELRAITAQLGELIAAPKASTDADPPSPQADWSAREVLIELLEELNIPIELHDRVDEIRGHIEHPQADFDIKRAVHEIASLVSDMRGKLEGEKEDIEQFLSQMTVRLHDFDNSVVGAESLHNESYESGRDLDAAVQAEVQGIHSSVAEADSVDQLKNSVRERVETILSRVEEHRKVEEGRHEKLQVEVQGLRGHLQEMARETEDLRHRVHDEHEQALTDALTGIPNRLAYDERIEQEYARWKRFKTPLALLVWDVDHFKKINDTYGHKAGDKVLQAIASVLSGHIRETDFLARYGGEEFAMLMPGADARVALDVANKLRREVENCGFHHSGEDVTITISCGLSEFRDGDSTETVFERADKALYQSKQQGRNQCQGG